MDPLEDILEESLDRLIYLYEGARLSSVRASIIVDRSIQIV